MAYPVLLTVSSLAVLAANPLHAQTMAKYFYYDADGKKQGPIDGDRIKELIAQETITPTTQMATDAGRTGTASQIIGLRHNTTASNPRNQDLLSDMKSPGIFDIGFTRFISNTWISIIWVILIIVHFLVAIGATLYSLNVGHPVPFLIASFAVPISLLFSRMALELEVIFFRIETNTRESKKYLREIKELLAQK